jgi:hypothetical protein
MAVADTDGRRQFEGDGTPEHPPLYDRDALAAFPFQLSDRARVVAVYVMSRDVRRDTPAEPFRLTLGGVKARSARVSLYDPAGGHFAPVRIAARSGDRLVLDVSVTDSPRLLFVDD